MSIEEVKQLFDQGLQISKEARAAAEDAKARLDDLETKLNRPGIGGKVDREDLEQKQVFENWLRRPKDAKTKAALDEIEAKSANSLTDPAGGHIVPEVIARPLMMRARDANPFGSLVRRIQVSSGDVVLPLSNADATSGWIGETGTRTGTTEPTLDGPKPTFGTLYAYVEASEELVMDSVFNVGEWFASEAGSAMGEAEMIAIVSGNGTNKPSGLLNTAPEAAADGSRTARALKYLPSGTSGSLGADAATVTDNLVSMIYDLKSRYRSNGRWVMNSATAGTIRKLKDADGRMLWSDGLANGEPSRLLGYPVVIAEGMPDIAADSHPVAFGDLAAGYTFCERGALRVTIDDNVTTPGMVRWYIRRRVGGIVHDENAIRVLKCSLS